MNLTDLLLVVATAAALYGLVVALSRQTDFLLRAVNPHRGAWILAAASCLWAGAGLMRWEAGSWHPNDWARVIGTLVTDAPLSPRGKVAAVGILVGIWFTILVFWCWFTLPRDPTTFRRPSDRPIVLRYYIDRLRGGLDYALLARGNGEYIAETVSKRQLFSRLPLLPGLPTPEGGRRSRTEEDQVRCWREAAAHLHASMPALDEAIAPAKQGRNVRLTFDGEYGGLFFIYLRHPETDIGGEGMYLFAATLNQEEMITKRAENHFDLMTQALRHIEKTIRHG